MKPTRPHIEKALLQRIRSEFHEMPGLCLTVAQASRLWNLDRQVSVLALHALVESGFLAETEDGRFVAAQWTTRQHRPGASVSK